MADEVLRNEKGQFLPGTKAIPGKRGRPKTEDAERLATALSEIIGNGTLPKWRDAMKRKLEKGDSWATEFVFERIAGKVPSETTLHVDTADIDAAIDAELEKLAAGSQAAAFSGTADAQP